MTNQHRQPRMDRQLDPTMNDVATFPEDFASRISMFYGKSVEMIVRVGHELLLAKRKLPHGEFGRMFKRHSHHIAHPLPFGERAGQMFMTIASNETIMSNANQGSVFPANWRTLAELARLPHEVLQAGIASGAIHAQMQRAEVTALRTGETQKPRSWSLQSAEDRLRLAVNYEITHAPAEERVRIIGLMRRLIDDLEELRDPVRQDDVQAARDQLDIRDSEPGGYLFYATEAESARSPGSPVVVGGVKSTYPDFAKTLLTNAPGVTALRRTQLDRRLDDLQRGLLSTRRTERTYQAVEMAIDGAARRCGMRT